MKEYIAQTGGRYTYADDIENLQELSLSMTALFEGCEPFIISGCEVAGMKISPGYVWLAGKVRRFEGAADAVFPYYICEKNITESVVYANEQNKQGRVCYLCAGSRSVPDTRDPLTGLPPQYLEVRQEYAPRLADRFFGRYAVLADTPFARQSVRKDLMLLGAFAATKEISSQTALTVVEQASGRTMQQRLRASGDASLGLYLDGLPVNEMLLGADGNIRFMQQERELARIATEGVYFPTATCGDMRVGAVLLEGCNITNIQEDTDHGAICINNTGFQSGIGRFRNFEVYDGRGCTVPLLRVCGSTSQTDVSGLLRIASAGRGMEIVNTAYRREEPKLTGALTWRDSDLQLLAEAGYLSTEHQHFTLSNAIGDLHLRPLACVDIEGDLRIRGRDISATYLAREDFERSMSGKVDMVAGKQLSTEDFTSELRRKLEAIHTGELGTAGPGYVTAASVTSALEQRLGTAANLADVTNRAEARRNLEVYSWQEANSRFLRIEAGLGELVALTAEEINDLTPEQATALKARKQQAVRTTLDAEQAGAAATRLLKDANLADVGNKDTARDNLGVYSATQVDGLLAGKLGVEDAYTGEVFTPELRQKLEQINGGCFAYTDEQGTSQALVDGYASTAQVARELRKKAERLLDDYEDREKQTIAANLGVYTIAQAGECFARVESLLEDYISYQVRQGVSTTQAQQTLREHLDVPSRDQVAQTYLRKDAALGDLTLAGEEARRQVCRNIGAAYQADVEPRIPDTGWLQMLNSGSGTDTRNLYVRQIGNIVSIQGSINTARRDGNHWGGTVGVLPNAIQPPKYSVRCTAANWNDDHSYNRGVTFTLYGGKRQVQLFESGMYNVEVEFNFTYFV